MYNGIGLPTPRGSGTSGFIQRNLSFFKNQLKHRDEFLKNLKQIHEKPIEAHRKANPEILEHEQKREIQLHLLELREKLEEMGIPEEEIEQRLKKAEEKLKEKMKKGEILNAKDSHQQKIAKERQYEKIKEAFKIKDDYTVGKSFDFDGQKKDTLEKQYNKELEKKEKIEKYKEEKRQQKKEQKKLEKLKKKEEKLQKKQQKQKKKLQADSDEEKHKKNKKKHKKASESEDDHSSSDSENINQQKWKKRKVSSDESD